MKTIFLAASLFVLSAVAAFGQIDPVDHQGLAIGGYDPVSYFTTGKAIKGDKTYTSVHNGVTYLFSSKENQQRFEADATRYLPQYEGYCALAVSYGKKISIDPNTFKIAGDKLYLFYNGDASGKRVNSLDTWNRHEARLLQKADELWPDVKKKKYKSGEGL